MAALTLYQQPAQELTGPFSKLTQILDLQNHPKCVGKPLAEIRLKQAELVEERVIFLASQIERYSFEVGCLLIEGGKLGLHLLMGHSSVYSWFLDGMGVSQEVLSLASSRYQAWLYIRAYGFTPDDVRTLGREKLQRLADITRDTDRQISIIAEQLKSDEPDLERQELLAKAEEEFRAQMYGEIKHIQMMRPEDLRDERATIGGEAVRPDFIVSKWSYDPYTGRLQATLTTDLEEGHLLALARGQHRFFFQQPTGEKLTQQEFAELLLSEREEAEEDN